MTKGPPLHSGEEIVFDHIPSLKAFKRAALFLIFVSLMPTIAFALAMPDSYWVSLPLFLCCLILMQERFRLGRHRAWITNARIILLDGTMIDLDAITSVKVKQVAVRVRYGETDTVQSLHYPENGAVLSDAINDARKDIS